MSEFPEHYQPLMDQLRARGFQFEDGYAVSPDGRLTYIASSFTLEDLLKNSRTGESQQVPRRTERASTAPASSPTSTSSSSSMGRTRASVDPDRSILKSPLPETTALHRNPFAILGASIHDDRRRISSLAEDLSLTADPEVCTRAKNDLISSRHRLTAEISWMPGVSPSHAKAFLGSLHTKVDLLRGRNTLPPLANANLIAAAFELLSPDTSADLWCEWIVAFANKVDSIDPEDVLEAINGDRATSGFPAIGDADAIETALRERRRQYSEAIRSALDELPSQVLIALVGKIVERTTDGGEDHAPQLIHDIVDRYEMHAGQFLDPEAENIEKLIAAIRRDAPRGEAAVQKLVNRLDELLHRWDSVAQPIQLSKKAQGLTDDRSHALALKVRSLSVDLFNEHDMLDTTLKLNNLLSSVFAEIPAMEETLSADRKALDGFRQNRIGAKQQESAWAQEITYETQVGLLFKKTLRISPDGIEWRGRTIALASISHVRWGAVRKSINGIPSGTDYLIDVATSRDSLQIDPESEAVFSAFLERLWKAVCTRLIGELIRELKAGNQIRFGGVAVDDAGVVLTRARFLGDEKVYTRWSEVKYYSHNGSLHLVDKNDERISAQLSYRDVYNAHLLEAIIRIAFKDWRGRLSANAD